MFPKTPEPYGCNATQLAGAGMGIEEAEGGKEREMKADRLGIKGKRLKCMRSLLCAHGRCFPTFFVFQFPLNIQLTLKDISHSPKISPKPKAEQAANSGM